MNIKLLIKEFVFYLFLAWTYLWLSFVAHQFFFNGILKNPQKSTNKMYLTKKTAICIRLHKCIEFSSRINVLIKPKEAKISEVLGKN